MRKPFTKWNRNTSPVRISDMCARNEEPNKKKKRKENQNHSILYARVRKQQANVFGRDSSQIPVPATIFLSGLPFIVCSHELIYSYFCNVFPSSAFSFGEMKDLPVG